MCWFGNPKIRKSTSLKNSGNAMGQSSLDRTRPNGMTALRRIVVVLLLLPLVLAEARPPVGGWFRRHRELAVAPFVPLKKTKETATCILERVRGGASSSDTESPESSSESSSSSSSQPNNAPYSYHLLSILPATDASTASDDNDEWTMAPGCAALTDTTVSIHRGNPEAWRLSNLPLVETLATVSDVVVLTMPRDDDGQDSIVSPQVGQALYRGWHRRAAQGLPPGRLWVVKPGKSGNQKDKQAWFENFVVQEWASEVSASPIEDWQLYHGSAEYTMAVANFLQQEQPKSILSSLVPANEIPSFLSLVYASLSVADPTHQSSKTVENVLFVTNQSEATPSKVPVTTEDSIDQAEATEPKPELAEAAIAPSSDDSGTENENGNQIWSKLDQVQNELDEYWLTGSTSGLTLPPDLVQALQAVWPTQKSESNALQKNAAFVERLTSLTDQHANILRDYYGRLYESLLESGRAADASTMTSLSKQYQSVVQRVNKSIYRYVKTVSVSEVYKGSYEGLQEDFGEINDRWQSAAEVMFEDDEDGSGNDTARRRRVLPPWLGRLAVRVLVLGVNYLQGWLAWQGVQRAALARERQLPKFPLF